MPGRKSQISTSLPDWMQVQIKRICDYEGVSMSSFIAEAIAWYVSRWQAKYIKQPQNNGKQPEKEESK
jgi:hypothetical protein